MANSHSGPDESARAAEQRLHGIIDSAMDAIITIDARNRVTLFNRAAERIFGYEAREVLGKPVERLMPARFRPAHSAHVERFGRTGVSSRPMGHTRIVSAQRKSGEEFPIDASISQVQVDGRAHYTVILRDVSERVKAEAELAQAREELRELAIASRTAREEENRRISRELHDELGQNLTSLKMDIAWLEQSLPEAAGEVRKTIANMRSLVDRTVASTRRISADLRPLMLDDLGLGPALEWIAAESAKRHGFEVALDVDPACAQLGEPLASQIYRMVQEGLTNAARHAQAKRVAIRLAERGDEIELEIEDDGRGIAEGDLSKKGSFGLMGLRERVHILAGRVRIESGPGRGTRIFAALPRETKPQAAG
jgi:PAS domain S-box-containing protein